MLHGPAKARLNASKGGNYGYALLVVVNVPIRKSITGGSLPFGPFIAMGIAACLCSRVVCLKCGASPQALGIGLEMEIRDKVGPFVIEAAGWRWREESQDTNTQDPAEASPTLNGRRMEQILRLKSSTRSGLPAKPEVASPSPHREVCLYTIHGENFGTLKLS